MRQLAVRLGVSERISTPGGVAKTAVAHWLNEGDIFINTTNVDNTPVAGVIEAMACGLCVVEPERGKFLTCWSMSVMRCWFHPKIRWRWPLPCGFINGTGTGRELSVARGPRRSNLIG
ncbi:MAG: hypothetical protein WKF84_20625 [Pyrinomonadaceae bacterium]